jgi:hypothetical protein
MAKTRGLQYRIDQAAQGFGPQRAADNFGLRHPKLDALSYVIVAVIIGLAIGFWTTSVLWGIIGGVVGGVLVVLNTRRNHRRRVANGTSAEYGPRS